MGAIELGARALSPALPALSTVGVYLLVCVLLWSGVSKLARPHVTALALVEFGVIPHFDPRAAKVLGVIELALAASLALPAAAVLSLAFSCVVFGTFAGAIAVNLHAGKDFVCGCFGDEAERLSRGSLVRAVALTSFALVLLVFAPEPWTTGLAQSAVGLAAAAGVVFSTRLARSLPELSPRHSHGSG